MPQHWPSHPAAQNNAKLPQVWRYNTRLVHYYNIRLCKWIPFFIPHTTCCNSHDAGSRPIKIQHRIWPQFYRVRECRVVMWSVMWWFISLYRCWPAIWRDNMVTAGDPAPWSHHWDRQEKCLLCLCRIWYLIWSCSAQPSPATLHTMAVTQ